MKNKKQLNRIEAKQDWIISALGYLINTQNIAKSDDTVNPTPPPPPPPPKPEDGD